MATMPPSPFTALPASSAETLAVAPGPQASVAAASGPFDSGDPVAPSPDEATAPQSSQAPGAVADIPEPTSSTGGPQESPASGQELCGVGDLDLIGEIFVGARKLESVPDIFEFDHAAILPEDLLLHDVLKAMVDPRLPGLREIPDEQALFDAIEPPPLFLQAVGY